ncbi:MAG: response regulator [Lachnospiraceae bacterium]|nr:response regulator [Lachnospiraceae bacterium]
MNYRILLVDDEREEREGIAFLIEKFRFPMTIYQANNGEKALEILKERKIDIVITDVKMPVMDGLELLNIIAQKYPAVATVIYSAYSEFEFAKRAIEIGVVNYLLKPIEIEDFKRCMENILEKKKEEKVKEDEVISSKKILEDTILQRVFQLKQIKDEDRNYLNKIFFIDKKRTAIPVFIEFADNYFEKNAENFLTIIETYIKESFFIELLPSEGYIVTVSKLYNDKETILRQLKKLMSRISNAEYRIIVGGACKTVEEIIDQIKYIEDVRKDLFIFGNNILMVSDYSNTPQRYVKVIEDISRTIINAIETRDFWAINENSTYLCKYIMETGNFSRIYVYNILYSIIKALYDKMPQGEYEDVLLVGEELFSQKQPEKILESFMGVISRVIHVNREKEEKDSEIISRVKNYINKEYKKDISLASVAESVGLAPAYLSHLFKKDTGIGIIEYITELKMKKAALLLADKKIKINQVARNCGYDNPSYFNRLFKLYYGKTPKQFREDLIE